MSLPSVAGYPECIRRRAVLFWAGLRAWLTSLAGSVLYRAGQFEALILNKAGAVLFRRGLNTVALWCWARSVERAPGNPAIHAALGEAYLAHGDQSRAFGHLWAAVFGAPEYIPAWAALARLYLQHADYATAALCSERAWQIDPQSRGLRTLHAASIAPTGRIAEALALSDLPHIEALALSDVARTVSAACLSVPAWDGSGLNGQRVLVWAPGSGFGDYIQFVRYVPLLVERGARVVLCCRPELRRLFSTLRRVELVTSLEALRALLNAGQIDCHVHLVRLPIVFKTAVSSLPPPLPYHVPVDGPALPRRNPSACAVGLVWASSPYSTGAVPGRSVPFAALLPLVATPGVEWFSLQCGAATGDLRRFGMAGLIHDLSPQLQDFADTATAIRQLDLVVTVDTSVAHLAGAMGKPVWILLPYAADWRWFDGRTDTRTTSPWYPSARLFRQPWPGNWVSPIMAVREALQGLTLDRNEKATSSGGPLSAPGSRDAPEGGR